ncbi:hypothetical protein SLEP1_g35455 [Rubroshorea leprosula]|uniref:Exocyst subunit Exo70 family protein n=1 Tax=Rubroshorea leprosula TaxID=152421 RepID=A0AAV5KNA7_9ROSI|nr:hypothetical protein SLEP1_g35455 [Rubroshorea leprosula]
MENNLPEKSSTFNKRDVHIDDINSETSLPVEESTKFAAEEKPTATETDIKEEKPVEDDQEYQKNAEIETIETEDAPPPLEIQYTVETALEDVDRFLTTLCAPNGEDEESSLNIPEFAEKCLDLVEETIVKHESGEFKAKWGQLAEDDIAFFDTVDRISKLNISISKIKSHQNHSLLINRICGIQQRAMSFLEDEFRILLEEPRSVESEQSSGDTKAKQEQPGQTENYNSPSYTPDILSSLNRIAKEMIAGGFESECCQVYTMARRNAFDEQLSRLGFEKTSIDDMQKMQWEALEREIPKWIKTFKECTILFSSELKLAEEIFTDSPSISSSLFINLTRGLVIQFLNFAEAVAMTKRSAEKLFKYLDMYETLRDSLPALDTLFPQELANQLRTEMTTTRCRVGEAAICIFCDLENSIKSDTGKTPVPGGTVHPLTRYTVNYLKYACEYKDTLEMVFKEHSKIERADSTSRTCTDYDESYNRETGVEESQSPFSSQLMRMMDLLDANLAAKSKLYRDISLTCIFMMNNGRYMLQKVKGSAEIHSMVGDIWCRKKSSELRNFHKNYQRETWTKLLGCLSHEGLTSNGKVMKPVLKERFKSFNVKFDEIHKTQSTWVVSDEQLQSELRVSIQAVMIPAYRSFLARFSQVLDPGRQTEKYIKFQPEDIENYIEELFDGNATSMARRRV